MRNTTVLVLIALSAVIPGAHAQITWNPVPGGLRQISASNDGTVFGVNATDDIYQWNGSGWSQVAGKLRTVSAGSKNNIWGVNSTGNIFKYTGANTWQQISGGLSQISAAADGTVVGVNNTGQVFRYAGSNSWTQIPGNLSYISAGNANAIWGLGTNNAYPGSNSKVIYQWTGSTWQLIDGGLSQISVAADGSVMGVNDSNQLYNWNTSTSKWDQVQAPQQAVTLISLTFGGRGWALTTNQSSPILSFTTAYPYQEAAQFSPGAEFENHACDYYIYEQTNYEHIGIGPPTGSVDLVVKTGTDTSAKSHWYIYPAQDPNGTWKWRFMTLQNGEFMSVNGAGGVIRWALNPSDKGQYFQFFNIATGNLNTAAFNLVEGTNGEFLSTSPLGNLRRWAQSRGTDQLYKLQQGNCAPRPTNLPNVQYTPNGIPFPVQEVPITDLVLTGVPQKHPEYVVGTSLISALGTQDDGYTDKLTQMQQSPWYTLVHKQYWSREPNRGAAYSQPTAGVTQQWQYTVQNGFTYTDMTSISHTVGWEISGGAEASGSVALGAKDPRGETVKATEGAKANLAFKYSQTDTTMHQTGTTTNQTVTTTTTRTLAPTGKAYVVVAWSLVDKFELYRSNAPTPMKTWENVQPITQQNLQWWPEDTRQDAPAAKPTI